MSYKPIGDNLKVHYVYTGGRDRQIALDLANVKYRLYSAYNYIKGKKLEDDFRTDSINYIKEDSKFCGQIIQDSGLFTFMFGSDKNVQQTPESIALWQKKLIKFVKQNELNVTVVENDCQKLLGTDFAWKLRRELREELPNHKIINVFHLEDGKEGLDRLIDFSDYIAVSVPELRIHRKGTYREDTYNLTRYIKSRKNDIQIHLLGCTEPQMLKDNKFCTSSDSSSWLAGVRYGMIKNNHVDDISAETSKDIFEKISVIEKERNLELSDNARILVKRNYLSATYHLDRYIRSAGAQD